MPFVGSPKNASFCMTATGRCKTSSLFRKRNAGVMSEAFLISYTAIRISCVRLFLDMSRFFQGHRQTSTGAFPNTTLDVRTFIVRVFLLMKLALRFAHQQLVARANHGPRCRESPQMASRVFSPRVPPWMGHGSDS